MTTFTLISAQPGDHVPGRELADLDYEIPAILERADVQAFFAANGYGPDDADELMYLVTDGSPVPDGFPALTFTIGKTDEQAAYDAGYGEGGSDVRSEHNSRNASFSRHPNRAGAIHGLKLSYPAKFATREPTDTEISAWFDGYKDARARWYGGTQNRRPA